MEKQDHKETAALTNSANHTDAALLQNGDGHKTASKEANSGEAEREQWSGKLDFFMSALSFAVGMGNMWRFPYLVYKNGGGAFLIPYIILMVFTGFPLMFLEFSLGQFGREGIVSVWKVCPIFQGIGWAMFLVSFFTTIYYSMLNAWCIFYIAASFAKDVPWRHCGNSWNTEACAEQSTLIAENNCSGEAGVWFNRTCFTVNDTSTEVFQGLLRIVNATPARVLVSPSDEYYHHRMLGISPDLGGASEIQWHLALCLLFIYIVVVVCLGKGIKTSGKVTYVTAMFPYFVLIILFIRGITLPGAINGIVNFLTPQWHSLATIEVWQDAAVQVFFSLSACWGGLITLASYNNFHNNALRDSLMVSTGDCLTSIFGGVVVFAFIGYMANIMNTTIDKVATHGVGLAFIVYPQAVTTLPISPLWSVLFMLMLLNVGIGSLFTLVTTTHTTLLDAFPQYLKKGHRPIMFLVFICSLMYLMGLVIASRSGIYVLQLMDNYSATYGALCIGVIMMVAVSWVYGHRRFFADIKMMIGYTPSRFWMVCWGVITPTILSLILVSTLLKFQRTHYGSFTLPLWCDVVGWMIVVAEIGVIPAVAIYKIATADPSLTLIQRIKFLSKPSPGWRAPDDVTKPVAMDDKGADIKLLNGPSNTAECKV